MSDRVPDCADVDAGDLEVLYVTGRLGEEEAEALEEHLMVCDRCFGLVERALEVRAAEGLEAPVAAPAELAPRPWARERWPLLAAAASVAAVTLAATWWGLVGRGPDLPSVGHPELGDLVSLARLRLTVHPHPTRLRVSWSTFPEAEWYHASLLTGEGLAVHDQEVRDTMVSVAVSEIEDLAGGGELYWHVDAMDASGAVLAHAGPAKAGFAGRRY